MLTTVLFIQCNTFINSLRLVVESLPTMYVIHFVCLFTCLVGLVFYFGVFQDRRPGAHSED